MLYNAIHRCTSGTAGPDGISRRILLDSLPVTFPIVLDLFNLSLNSSSFPDSWKRSHVVPIPKSKTASAPSDFRPISLLSFLSKVLERLAYNHLSTHLNRLLDPLQTGFRPGSSTQTALIKLTDDVRLAVDRRQVTLLVLFDFSKAFDTVPHELLLRKLERYHLSPPVVRWLRSYLSNRTQCVRGADGSLSTWAPILAGVPQGSVLGPLLFAVFVDDLRASLHHCKHLLYADDLQIYYHFPPSDLEAATDKMREDIASIERWSNANHLRLNSGKTKAILLGSARFVNHIHDNHSIALSLNNVPIEIEDSVVNLGVHFTSTLSWRDHIRSVSNKVNGVLWSLKLQKNCFSVPLRVWLVTS